MWDRFFRQRAYIGITRSRMRWYVRKIESIIGVQWGQKNPNPRAHRSSGKRGLPSFPLERWTRGLGFFWYHWTPMIDSFSHIPRPFGTVLRGRTGGAVVRGWRVRNRGWRVRNRGWRGREAGVEGAGSGDRGGGELWKIGAGNWFFHRKFKENDSFMPISYIRVHQEKYAYLCGLFCHTTHVMYCASRI